MVFGPAGLYVRLLSECWSEKQDCSGYFPLGIGISNLMSWPIFVTERLAFGEHGFVSRYDTAIARYWWILLPALWLYDYTVFAAAKVLVGFIRSVGRASAKAHPTMLSHEPLSSIFARSPLRSPTSSGPLRWLL